MSKKYELIIALPCPFCINVLNFINENGFDFVTITDTKWDQSMHDSIQKNYGKSQVPLLLVNNEPIYESLDIIDFLRSHHL